MSAIYGAIDLNGRSIDEGLAERFDAEYAKCKIDRNKRILQGNVYMHCGLQFFYPRAEAEDLPMYDSKNNIFFTSDCVIDNRKPLIAELGLDNDAPDGKIIYKAYEKWGKDCTSHLQGLFSFVFYDASKNEVFAAVDQFQQRCLFYHVRDGVFYFSTLFFPLAAASHLKFKENERWLVDTLSLRSPVMITEPKETSLMDVFKVVCGTSITVSLNNKTNEVNVQENRYFDPNATIKTDWKMTLKESEELVRTTMHDVLEDILQEQQDVAAHLSAGLDSSAVVCTAAPIVEKHNGKIYSYTSVPLKKAGIKNNAYELYDETEGVKIICDAYSNIVPEFVECEDRSYLLEAEDIIDKWEMPCKSQHNAIWVDEISKKVSERGLRILLNGATGNCTLSAGMYTDVIRFYLRSLKFKSAYEVFDTIQKLGIKRTRYAKAMVQDMVSYYKWYFDPEMKDCYARIVTKKEVGERNKLTKRFRKLSMHFHPYTNMKRMRNAFYLINAYTQIGELDTKDSLKYGILKRDPMSTVPVVSMCYRIPIYCYANKDYDRRLVRAGMAGVVPEKTRNNIIQRGRQSGDNSYRAGAAWNSIAEKWKKTVFSDEVLRYIDESKVESLIKKYEEVGIEKTNEFDARLAGDLYSFAIYIKKLAAFK